MEEKYLEIIKKQQELINLMLEAGISNKINITEKISDTKKQNILCDAEGFESWLSDKGRSANTICTYVSGVKSFFNRYKLISAETLAEYEKFLTSQFAPQTINLRLTGIMTYCEYIGFTEYKFKRVKEQRKTFCDDAINEEQYNQLLNYALENNVKVWLVAKVIANTGVRVSELIELKTKDLNKGYADIVGKGNKQRRIYFPQSLIDDIANMCGQEYILENKFGQQYSAKGIAGILQKTGIKAGIPKEVLHPHSLRHFFAKQFLRQKNDISLLGDLLGHSSIATTAIYTRLTSEEQQKQINELIDW